MKTIPKNSIRNDAKYFKIGVAKKAKFMKKELYFDIKFSKK